jgi:hypothetical protein
MESTADDIDGAVLVRNEQLDDATYVSFETCVFDEAVVETADEQTEAT